VAHNAETTAVKTIAPSNSAKKLVTKKLTLKPPKQSHTVVTNVASPPSVPPPISVKQIVTELALLASPNSSPTGVSLSLFNPASSQLPAEAIDFVLNADVSSQAASPLHPVGESKNNASAGSSMPGLDPLSQWFMRSRPHTAQIQPDTPCALSPSLSLSPEAIDVHVQDEPIFQAPREQTNVVNAAQSYHFPSIQPSIAPAAASAADPIAPSIQPSMQPAMMPWAQCAGAAAPAPPPPRVSLAALLRSQHMGTGFQATPSAPTHADALAKLEMKFDAVSEQDENMAGLLALQRQQQNRPATAAEETHSAAAALYVGTPPPPLQEMELPHLWMSQDPPTDLGDETLANGRSASSSGQRGGSPLPWIFGCYDEGWHKRQNPHSAPPFFSLLPRAFQQEHLVLAEQEPCTIAVKHHGSHFNLCFLQDRLYVRTREGPISCLTIGDDRPATIPLSRVITTNAMPTSFMVDAEFVVQERDAHVDAVFYMFPIHLKKSWMYERLRREQERPRYAGFSPRWITGNNHALCDRLGKHIRHALGVDYLVVGASPASHNKPVHLRIVSKEWFTDVNRFRAFLRGRIQRYAHPDPCFPFVYYRDSTHEWKSSPIDGVMCNFLGQANKSEQPEGAPLAVECKPEDMMEMIASASRLHLPPGSTRMERLLPPGEVAATHAHQTVQCLADPHYRYRTRVAKWKPVHTLDLRISTTLHARSLLIKARVAPTSVEYHLTCLQTTTDAQLRGPQHATSGAAAAAAHSRQHGFDQFVGIGIAFDPAVAGQLWNTVVMQGISVIVECALHQGVFRIQLIRRGKTQPNHANTVHSTLLQIASPIVPAFW
jgi:hypothetical protein